MKTVMTLTELLTKLKLAKKQVEADNYTLTTGKDIKGIPTLDAMLVGLQLPEQGTDINHIPIEDAAKRIQSNWDTVAANKDKLNKLTMIKDTVNHTTMVSVPNPNYTKGGTVTLSIAEVLTLKGKQNEYRTLLTVMRNTYQAALDQIAKYTLTNLSDAKASDYATKMIAANNSDASDEEKKILRSKYYDEYIKQNKIEILDPINIKDKIDKLEAWITDFYGSIDYKLSEINATTKIEVDLDLDEDFFKVI